MHQTVQTYQENVINKGIVYNVRKKLCFDELLKWFDNFSGDIDSFTYSEYRRAVDRYVLFDNKIQS